MLRLEEKRRMNLEGDFPYRDKHVKIDNSNLSAEETARRIQDAFELPRLDIEAAYG